jgi:hypothetical protein
MHTATGGVYWPCDPRAEEVRIEDIAHHLGMICRYTGACRRFYSVAEHSLLVSYRVPERFALVGLLHDATEAYISDLNRPTKHGPGMEGYRRIEALNWLAIAEAFDLPVKIPDEVEVVDHEMLFHEEAALMPPCPSGMDFGMGLPKPAVLCPEIIAGLSPETARVHFLTRFEELTK